MRSRPSLLLTTTIVETADSFLDELATRLTDEGWRVELATNMTAATKRARPYAAIHDMPWGRGHTSPLGATKAIPEIRRVISTGGHDIVHTHTPVASAVTRFATLGMRPQPIMVYTAHGFHFTRGVRGWDHTAAKAAETILIKATDVIITINEEDYRWAQKAAGHRTEVYLTNGVGIRAKYLAARPRAMRAPHDPLRAITIGQLRANKRQALAMEAMALLGRGSRELVVVGEGPDSVALRERARQLTSMTAGLSITFTGQSDDVTGLLRSADVMVHSSEREGLPTVVIEAMASGLPVVAFAIRGCTDLLDSGAGILVQDPNDLLGLVTALETIRDNPAQARQMGERGQSIAQAYERELAVDAIVELYDSALSARINPRIAERARP